MTFRVLHHNQCFDGACSAAVFTKFHRECFGSADGYEYVGLAHQAGGGGLSDSVFGPGENAVVDFKYSSSPKLTWWFDHHQSAFVTQEERANFDLGQRGEMRLRQFFDPEFVSCTSFIAAVGASRFGWDVKTLGELLYWADIVDGAKYESAKAAVEMLEPAMKLTLVIENAEKGFIPRIVPLLTSMPLAEVLAQPFVQERVSPLLRRHRAAMDLVRERAELGDGVITLDLLDRETEALNKFIPYYFYPKATYTVAVTRSRSRTKISVGTNPWTSLPAAKLENIAEICERFGGGGHARVGAISFGADEVDRARIAAGKIAAELRG